MKTDQKPKSPEAYGIEMSKLWTLSGMPFPIKPGELALEVSKARFEDKIAVVHSHSVRGIDGMLTKSKTANEWFILYDETVDTEGRINFTVAHEFGHYLLHRTLDQNFNCTQSKILGFDNNSAGIIEREANIFASYLLMPIDDFRKQVGNNKMSLELLAHCAHRYNVSMTAASIKWAQFTDEAAVVVVARDGFILWAATSQSARKAGVRFSKGDPLPNLAEQRVVSGAFANRAALRRPPGVWHTQHEAIEDLIISDKYEVDIFFVTFPYARTPEYEEEKVYDTLEVMRFISGAGRDT